MLRSEPARPLGACLGSVLPAEFRPVLMRYFSRRVSERAEIEDLVQDVLARLLCGTSLDRLVNQRSYVFETAHRVLIDWLRKRRSRQVREHESFDPEVHVSEDFSTDRVLAGQEDLKRAIAILQELPERTRAVFVLHRIEGMRYVDIAARLGLSASAVEKRMYTAVRHLIEGMEPR